MIKFKTENGKRQALENPSGWKTALGWKMPQLFSWAVGETICVPVLLGYGLGSKRKRGGKTPGFGWVFKFRKHESSHRSLP